eukprot:3363019-Heterocapsa_arctica.AAC.1
MEFSRAPGGSHTRGVILGEEEVLIREVFNLTPVSTFQGPKESHDGAEFVIRRAFFDLGFKANDGT